MCERRLFRLSLRVLCALCVGGGSCDRSVRLWFNVTMCSLNYSQNKQGKWEGGISPKPPRAPPPPKVI